MHKKIKIAFIQPINLETLEFRALNENSSVFAYLKSYTDKYLPSDFIEYKIINDIDDLKNEKFDILGVSAYSPYFYHAVNIITRARKLNPDIFIILGGYHITLVPDNLPDEADVGVIGEGEETFVELISLYSTINSGKEIKKQLYNVKGIVFKDNTKLVFTDPRMLIEPLDKIPFFDKSMFRHYDINNPVLYIHTSRGCPFNCSFCSVILTLNKKYREFSADYVIDEITQNLRLNPSIKEIAISDETFGVNRVRLRQIVDSVEKSGINKKISFVVSVRADMVDEEFCSLLKRLNTKAATFGAESGSNRILSLLKQNITVEDNERACRLLTQAGIESVVTMIIGTPSETENDLISTFNFISDNVARGYLKSANIAILTPFPGTVWWNYALEQGWVSEQNMNWTKLDNMFINCIPFGMKKTFGQWRAERENYGIYLNKYTIPEKRFYDLLGVFFDKLSKIIIKKLLNF